MRVLFVSHRLPYPPNKGDKIRAFNEIRSLARRGHEVHLITFADPRYDAADMSGLNEICESVTTVAFRHGVGAVRALRSLLTGESLSLGYFGSARMRSAVMSFLVNTSPDAVVVYSSAMAGYIPSRWRGRTVADLVDVDSEKWLAYSKSTRAPRRWLYATEGRRLRAFEYQIVKGFGRSVLSTQRESEILNAGMPAAELERLRTITNGVELDYYRPSTPVRSGRKARNLVFVGAMDYWPNVDGVCYFVDSILPLVRRRCPDVGLTIVGSRPTPAVCRLTQVAGVSVTGYVDDVRPYLASASAAVVPLRIARGVQNKVLEAMASGVPVVASREAVAGLDIKPGRDLLVCDSSGEFADAVVDVLGNDIRASQLARAGRHFVETQHNWDTHMQRFVDLVESVAGRESESAVVEGRLRAGL